MFSLADPWALYLELQGLVCEAEELLEAGMDVPERMSSSIAERQMVLEVVWTS